MRSIMGSKILSSDTEDENHSHQESECEDSHDVASQNIEDWLTSLQSRFDDLAGRRFGASYGD